MIRAGVAVLACLGLATSCSAVTTSSPSRAVSATAARVRLVPIATLAEPLALTVRSGDPALYVAEKSGRVIAIRDGEVDATPVLDLSNDVSLGGEQGLLGIAFSPDGAFLYVNYTDVAGDTRIEEFVMRAGRADVPSRREVLTVHQPYSNHNGGNLVFGPDGYLYIGLGDGGNGGDPHGNGQSLSTLLGKMLRIDPRPSGEDPYGIPPDNPFVDTPGARPEIWAYGLRNPWRYSFDRATGDLWIGDVGQFEWEEVDMQPASSTGGENYGWNVREGAHPFAEGDLPPDAVDPVYDYSHRDGGCVVTGGYVYRGEAIPSLVGAYLFADFCVGALETLRIRDGVAEHAALGPRVQAIGAFGQDGRGELYAVSLNGEVYRLEAR